MKRIIFILVFSLFLTTINAQTNYANNQVILKFNKQLNNKAQAIILDNKFNINNVDLLNTKFKLSKIELTGNKKDEKTYVLTFINVINVAQVIEDYKKTNLFKYVEPNYIGGINGDLNSNFIPNDAWSYPWQWSLHNDGTFPDATSTAGADISMDSAWDIEQGDPSIVVAILDSGNFISHQEFTGRIWQNSLEIMDGIDNDGNGLIDDINGWSFFDNTNNLVDVTGHGTNVTGIIGANGNNNIGYAGVDWHCKLMTLKVLDDSGSGFYSWWADAIHYAVDNGANVINMSLRGNSPSSVLEEAINYAYDNNVTIVAAVGNENINAIGYPAAYQTVIAVGATDTQDNRANPFAWGGGSNYGPEIDLVAPGNRIYGLNSNNDNNFSWYWSGTSQATPHVTGVVSLLLAQNNILTPDQINTILTESANDQVGLAIEDTLGFDEYYGYGRLNANEALLNASASVNDNNQTLFSIFPNPIVNGQFKINLSTNNYSDLNLNIYNTLGILVYSKHVTENEVINIASLTNGVYFVNLKNKTINYTKKVMKK